MSGKLYIVATPIGNLADMSARAIEVLQSVAHIAAEDTRHTIPLLQHYNIKTNCTAYHEHNEAARSEQLVTLLKQGDDVALVSDAGTPLISDPGYTLVQAALGQGVQVIPIPGACAMITALSASGLPTDSFYFAGFLPAKPAAREKQLQNLSVLRSTLIFYESTHRIIASLTSMAECLGAERQCVVGRELTKKFESFYYGSIDDVLEQLQAQPEFTKGEFVVMLRGAEKKSVETISEQGKAIIEILSAELPLKQAAKLTAEITGDKKNALYAYKLG